MTQVWCSDNQGSDNQGMDNRECIVLICGTGSLVREHRVGNHTHLLFSMP